MAMEDDEEKRRKRSKIHLSEITWYNKNGMYIVQNDFVMFNIFCHFLMWYPGSGVVLDCINTCSLPLSYFYSVYILLKDNDNSPKFQDVKHKGASRKKIENAFCLSRLLRSFANIL